LRYGDRGRAYGAGEPGAHELPRLEPAGGVRQLRPGLHRSGVRVHPHVGEVHLAGPAVDAPIGERDRHVEPPVRRELEALRVDVAADAQELAFRDAENDVDRVGLRHRREQHVRARHERALRAQRAARDAVDRRFDAGPVEIQLCLGDARLRALHLCSRDLRGRCGVVVLLAADRLDVDHRLHPLGIAPGLRPPRLGRREVGVGARERDLERRGIDLEERLAALHRFALAVIALEQDAGDACAHLDLAVAGGLAGVLVVDGQPLRLDLDHRHLGRRHLARRLAARLPAGGERSGEEDWNDALRGRAQRFGRIARHRETPGDGRCGAPP
jgi:hypothetical protein